MSLVVAITSRRGLFLRLFIPICCAVSIAALSRFVLSQKSAKPSAVALDTPASLLNQANHLSWLGNWYRAGELYERAETMFRSKGDRRNELYAHVGRIRANAQNMRWDRLSKDLIETLNDPVVTADKRLRLWCLAAKGYTDLNLDSVSAKADWTEALQVAQGLGEEDWAARATGELGTIAFLEGDTALAVSLIGKAVFSAYKTGDIDSQVRLLSMLGNGFNEERRFSEALTFFKRAVSTAEANPDAGFPFIAYAGIARALIGSGNYAQAHDAVQKALVEARVEDKRIAVAEMLMISGDAAMMTNDLPGAVNHYQHAAQITRELKFNRGITESMFALSNVERKLGDTRHAAKTLEVALEASRRLGDRYYLPRDLTALAELKVADKQFREAERLFEEAEDVLDGIIVHQHSFEESTARAGSMSPTYLGHFRLAQKMGNIERAFQVIERVRGRTVASKLFVREESGPKSPVVTKLEADIAGTQLALLRTEDPKSRSFLMEQLLADERRLAFELNEAGLNSRDILAKPAPLKAIQRALRDDELIAEYVLDEPTAFCIVANKSSAKLLNLPAGSNSIQVLGRSYLSELKAKRSGDPFAAELYRVLLAPIVKAFPQSRFIISPDDVLYSLPFEALRDEHGFFVRSRVVSYTPSGTVLWRIRNTKFEEGARPLLAVGAVDYKLARALPKGLASDTVAAVAVRGLAELSGSRLEDLPASRDEVLAIAQIAGPDSQLLLGQSATETEFKRQPLAEFRVIHLATHAAADAQYPDRAALILGVAHSTQDDGLLQVREIMGLSLNADLVTLSACDTNVGTDQREAGVVNLEQAFLIAGARAVVASLWNVDDSSTTALMKAFYAHLAQHEEKAVALTHAKRDMLERYGDASPYYWAPFVLVGEGALPVSFGR